MALPVPDDYSFGRKAEAVYEELAIGRSGVIDKARQLAAISIPTLFPPEGWRPDMTLPPPNQSINSENIDNLASAIMVVAMPPGRPLLRYSIIQHRIQAEIDQDPDLFAKTTLALALLEKAHRLRFEATAMRMAYVEMAAQLIIAGNGLWRHLKLNSPSVHRCDSYVVKRNAFGEQLYVILKERVNLGDMDRMTRAFIENILSQNVQARVEQNRNEFTDEVEIYSCCKLHRVSKDRAVWLYWEEFQGEFIPETDVMCEYDVPPLYAAWLKPSYGNNWGIGYAELHQGDMYKVENGEGSMNDATEAAGMVLLFVKPGGTTSKKVLEKARNLRWMYGNAEDLTTFRLDKGQDLQVVAENIAKAEQRLGVAFMRYSSFQRQAERVTAEEWKILTRELDRAMGGLYSSLAQGFGRHVMLRAIALHEEEDKGMPKLPHDVVQVGVITGLDNMGVSDDEADLENALGVIGKTFGPQGATTLLQPTNIVERILAGNNVNPTGLFKDDAQQQSEQQQATNTNAALTALKGASGPIAKEAAGALSAALTPKLAQQMQQAGSPTPQGS